MGVEMDPHLVARPDERQNGKDPARRPHGETIGNFLADFEGGAVMSGIPGHPLLYFLIIAILQKKREIPRVFRVRTI